MAGIDYTIPGQFKSIQIESPMNAMAQAMQLRNLQETSQLNALRTQEAQELNRQRNALARYLADPSRPTDPIELEAGVRKTAPLLADQYVDQQLKREQLREAKQTSDLKQIELEAKNLDRDLAEFNQVYSPALIRNVEQAKARTKALYAHPTLGERAARLMPEADALLRTEQEFTNNYEGYIASQSGMTGKDILEAENKRNEQDYTIAFYSAVERGEKPPTRNEFLARRRQQQLAPTVDAAAAAPMADAAAAAPVTDATAPAGIFAPRREAAAAPAPAGASDMSAKAAAYMLSGNPALVKLGEEIQKKFLKDVEANRPTYSEINLTDSIAVVKRDPVTGKSTVIEKFPIGISPADKQRLKNESTRIAQENRRIQLDAQRVGLETKRIVLAEQNAKRDADPAFQRQMAAARAEGEALAKDQVKAKQVLPGVILRGEESIRLIDELIGKAPVKDKNGKIIQEGTAPHPGFETAVGATWMPGMRFVPGSAAADFARRDEQLKGASFLEAFEILKGGGAITNIEGEKGTAAINRMSLAQSEREYIAAAREVQDILKLGMERARKRANVTAPAGQSSIRSEANAIIGIP